MFSWFARKGLLYFIRLGLMTVLTAFNFWLAVIRWGWSDADPVIKTSAMIIAGATEIGLFAFLVLFHLEFYSRRRIAALFGWGVASVACVGVSLYVNIGYFSVNWHDQAGNTLADLLIRALFPMALLLGFSMIPPKQKRTAADVQAEYASKIEEAKQRQQLIEIEHQAKDKRRSDQAKERAKQAQLLRIAGRDLARQYEVETPDGDIIMDWVGLEEDVRARGLYPEQKALATLPSNEDLIHQAKTAELVAELPAEEAQDEDDERSDSGNHRAYIAAEEVAEILGVSPTVAARMMAARSTHAYAIKNCKNIRLRKPVRGRSYERRAPYASVLEMKTTMEADRQAKVRPFLRPEAPTELQARA